jgi:predicted ferric reductase
MSSGGGYVFQHERQGLSNSQAPMAHSQQQYAAPTQYGATSANAPMMHQQYPQQQYPQQQYPQQQYPALQPQQQYPSMAYGATAAAPPPPLQQGQFAGGYQPMAANYPVQPQQTMRYGGYQVPAPPPPPPPPADVAPVTTRQSLPPPDPAAERFVPDDAASASTTLGRDVPLPATKAYAVSKVKAVITCLVAVLTLIVCFVGLGVWMRADIFQKTDALRAFEAIQVLQANGTQTDEEIAGFKALNVGFLIVFVLTAPWVLPAILIAVMTVCAFVAPRGSRRAPALILAFIGLVYAFVALALWAHRMVDCGIFWCLDPSVHPVPDADDRYDLGDPFRYLLGVMMFFVGLGFCFAMLRVAFAETFESCAKSLKCLYRDGQKADAFIALILAVIAIVMLFATMYLPNSLPEKFTPWKMALFANETAQCSNTSIPEMCPEVQGATMRTSSFRVNHFTSFNAYPPNLLFYVYLLIMLLGGLMINLSKLYRGFAQRRRVYFCGRFFYVTIASVTGWVLTVAMLGVFALYWFHDHNYHRRKDAGNSNMRVARGFGQLAVAFMSLQMFPVARTSVVHRVLGTSPESFLYAHRVLGYGTLTAIICHAAFWFQYYRDENTAIIVIKVPTRIPGTDDVNNYTIPVQTVLAFITIICMGVFGLAPIRRRCWELFKYTHLIAAYAIIPSTIYHAAASWEYLMPGLTVYIVDRFLRMSRSHRMVPKAAVTLIDNEHVRVAFTGGFVSHHAGQYAYINVPAISILEWHPFTISSAPGLDVRTMHVKSQGSGTFTGALLDIARQSPNEAVEIELFVDGPIGPTNLHMVEDYDAVILVAGGVGITPCASIVGDLMRQGAMMSAVRGEAKMAPRVSLLWVCKDGREMAASLDLPTCRNSLDSDFGRGLPSLEIEAYETRPTTTRTSAWPRAKLQGWDFQQGRPDMWQALTRLIPQGAKRPLLFVCGPKGLERSAVQCAQKISPGILVHTETFEL